jgi:hypothetical protein
MNNEQSLINVASGSNHLNNSGAPHSRKKSQNVYSDFLIDSQSGATQGIYYVDIPKQVTDVHVWLEHLAKNRGYLNLAAAIETIALPTERHIVYLDSNLKKTPLTPSEMLRAALILAKCNNVFYNPNIPPVLTRSRLERTLRLVSCNQNTFYGLDQ